MREEREKEGEEKGGGGRRRRRGGGGRNGQNSLSNPVSELVYLVKEKQFQFLEFGFMYSTA